MNELVGAAEIAQRMGLGKPTVVHDWRYRHEDFPEPVAELQAGLVWSWPDVRRWAVTTNRLRVYVDASGKIHDLIAPGAQNTGTVWVWAWLVATEPNLRWLVGDPAAQQGATDGMNGPNVYKVLKQRWDDVMGPDRPATDTPAGLTHIFDS